MSDLSQCNAPKKGHGPGMSAQKARCRVHGIFAARNASPATVVSSPPMSVTVRILRASDPTTVDAMMATPDFSLVNSPEDISLVLGIDDATLEATRPR